MSSVRYMMHFKSSTYKTTQKMVLPGLTQIICKTEMMSMQSAFNDNLTN